MSARECASKLIRPFSQQFFRNCAISSKISNYFHGNFRFTTVPSQIKRSVTSLQNSFSAVTVKEDFHEAKQADKQNSLLLDDGHKRSTLVDNVRRAILDDLPFNRLFAVVHIGGKQFKITSNDIIMVHKIAAKCGDKIRLRKVLMVGGREFSLIGKPLISDDHIHVEATVLEKTKGRNVIVFKKKRRKNYKKWKEHRQDITVLRINKIVLKPDIVA